MFEDRAYVAEADEDGGGGDVELEGNLRKYKSTDRKKEYGQRDEYCRCLQLAKH